MIGRRVVVIVFGLDAFDADSEEEEVDWEEAERGGVVKFNELEAMGVAEELSRFLETAKMAKEIMSRIVGVILNRKTTVGLPRAFHPCAVVERSEVKIELNFCNSLIIFSIWIPAQVN